MAIITISELNKFSEITIRAAGPRYTPGIDPSAPNLAIDSLVSAIDALAFSRPFRDRLTKMADDLEQAWAKAPSNVTSLFPISASSPTAVLEIIRGIATGSPGRLTDLLKQLPEAVNAVDQCLSNRRNELWKQREGKDEYSEDVRTINSELNQVSNVEQPLAPISSLLEAPDFKLIDTNRLFIKGQWGTGKTHFLCDTAKGRMANDLPTLLLLAHLVPIKGSLLSSIRQAVGLKGSTRALLKALNRMGERVCGRTLIIIDGINEADREEWRRGVKLLAQELARFDNLALVLSCRTPFDRQILSDSTRELFVEVPHRGFEEIEFDAQREFFHHYQIPTPHVPLLAPEFSRPLFLKILCRTFAGLTLSGKSIAPIMSDQVRDYVTWAEGISVAWVNLVKRSTTKSFLPIA
jgi:hypothetical protein